MNQKSLNKTMIEPKKLECWEKEFFEFWDYVTNNDNWIKGRAVWKGCAYLTLGNCVKSFIQSLIQSTKEETIREIINILEEFRMDKLTYPPLVGNPEDYGGVDWNIQIEEGNRKLDELEDKVNSLLKE